MTKLDPEEFKQRLQQGPPEWSHKSPAQLSREHREAMRRVGQDVRFHKKWEWDQWNEWAKRQIQISDEEDVCD